MEVNISTNGNEYKYKIKQNIFITLVDSILGRYISVTIFLLVNIDRGSSSTCLNYKKSILK